jgi:Fic family protein
MTTEIGKWILQPTGFRAFIPHPFPPKDGFAFAQAILKKAGNAQRLLGKLDGITKLLPDVDFFLLMYLRKDAESSSQIEGTGATMIDAIEAAGKISENLPADVDDILHYLCALDYGFKRINAEDFPLSLRFIRELHKKLMDQARSSHYSSPGEFRKSQNWISGTLPDNASFVPPPIEDMNRSLSDLEKFMHAEDTIMPVIKAGLIHAQFETIHPFLDGNGRSGRMLINFYFWQEKIIEKPVLFLSSYFKKHQKMYYKSLDNYHDGQVDQWIDFFLDGIIAISNEAIQTVSDITVLREKDMSKLHAMGKRSADSSIKVLLKLYQQPIVNVSTIKEWTGFSVQGALNVIKRFMENGILQPKNEKEVYGRSYVYGEYLKIFTAS